MRQPIVIQEPADSSLLDLCSALLMIFMFFAFLRQGGEPAVNKELRQPSIPLAALDSPGAKGGGKTETSLSIRHEGEGYVYFVGEKAVPLAGLGPALKAAPAVDVALRIAGDVPHEKVMEVLDICRKSKVENVAFVYRRTGEPQ